MRELFRILFTLCVVGGCIEVFFWTMDRITGQPYHGQWRLIADVVWGGIFWALWRWQVRRRGL
jgi:hypothetical protein